MVDTHNQLPSYSAVKSLNVAYFVAWTRHAILGYSVGTSRRILREVLRIQAIKTAFCFQKAVLLSLGLDSMSSLYR